MIVARRVGGLEKSFAPFSISAFVARRVGGLEKEAFAQVIDGAVARRVGGLEMIPILLACMRLVDRRVGGLEKHNYGDRELLRRCPPRRRFRNVIEWKVLFGAGLNKVAQKRTLFFSICKPSEIQ